MTATDKAKKKKTARKPLAPPREPPPPEHEWEQQRGETDLAFATFCVYRDLPPGDRGHDRVVAARNAKYPDRKDISAAETLRLSKTWRWAARVRLWDAMIAERSRDDEIEDAVQAKKRRLAIAKKLQTLSDKHLNRLIAAVEEGGQILTRDVIHAGVEGAKLERLEMGESTENVKIEATIAGLAQAARDRKKNGPEVLEGDEAL